MWVWGCDRSLWLNRKQVRLHVSALTVVDGEKGDYASRDALIDHPMEISVNKLRCHYILRAAIAGVSVVSMLLAVFNMGGIQLLNGAVIALQPWDHGDIIGEKLNLLHMAVIEVDRLPALPTSEQNTKAAEVPESTRYFKQYHVTIIAIGIGGAQLWMSSSGTDRWRFQISNASQNKLQDTEILR